MSANEKQVGGSHYKTANNTQHWDIVASHDLDYFQGQITKYVMRWKKKNGIEDLEKARHFLDKYIELEKARVKVCSVIAEMVIGKGLSPAGQKHPFGYNEEEENGTPGVDLGGINI